jgi:hypothetical protein
MQSAEVDKYDVLDNLINKVIEHQGTLVDLRSHEYLKLGDPRIQQHMQNIDDVIRYSMDNFSGDLTSQTAIDDARKIFGNREVNIRELNESVVPIYTVRTMILVHNIRIPTMVTKAPTWREFIEKYKNIVISV